MPDEGRQAGGARLDDLSREVAVRATLRARDDLQRAANAVPVLRRLWRPGGVAQHTVRIVAHSAASNMFFAAAISGAPLPYRTQEEQASAVAACESLEQATAFLNRSVAAVCEAIVALPASRLSEPMIMPWGERMPVALGLLSPSYHMQYHEGQVNYIQALLGDDEHH